MLSENPLNQVDFKCLKCAEKHSWDWDVALRILGIKANFDLSIFGQSRTHLQWITHSSDRTQESHFSRSECWDGFPGSDLWSFGPGSPWPCILILDPQLQYRQQDERSLQTAGNLWVSFHWIWNLFWCEDLFSDLRLEPRETPVNQKWSATVEEERFSVSEILVLPWRIRRPLCSEFVWYWGEKTCCSINESCPQNFIQKTDSSPLDSDFFQLRRTETKIIHFSCFATSVYKQFVFFRKMFAFVPSIVLCLSFCTASTQSIFGVLEKTCFRSWNCLQKFSVLAFHIILNYAFPYCYLRHLNTKWFINLRK